MKGNWKFLVLLADYFFYIIELSFLVLVKVHVFSMQVATRVLAWCSEFLYLWYVFTFKRRWVNLADKMPIQHWKPIVSQEFKVRIEITCLYDSVLLIHVVPPPSPTQPVLQITTLTPTTSIYNPGLVFVLKTTVI